MGDLPALLGLLDDAVAWLVARGGAGQWGTEPFSSNATMVAYVEQIAARGELRIAEGESRLVLGGYVLGACPEYAPAIDGTERYVEAMVGHRAHAGEGIGALLVADAVARARCLGAAVLRADCWARAERLIQWYEEQGFRRDGTVAVGDWPAQLLRMDL